MISSIWKNAPSLPFSALSVKDCQAAVPLDSNQAQKKNELFAVPWPQPSQSHWSVLFIICSGIDTQFFWRFPHRNTRSRLKSEFHQYLSAALFASNHYLVCPSLVSTFWHPPSLSVSLFLLSLLFCLGHLLTFSMK